jgi:hypothetical protein
MGNERKRIIRNFVIELAVYGALIVAYFIIVLSTLGGWLTKLYHQNLVVYAFVALILIVVQAVFLEAVTTFLIERLGLERLE